MKEYYDFFSDRLYPLFDMQLQAVNASAILL